jgi:hexokinase
VLALDFGGTILKIAIDPMELRRLSDLASAE